MEEKTPIERVKSLLQGILRVGYHPYDLKTRGGGRLSSAAAYQTKMIVEILPTLSSNEVEELMNSSYTTDKGKSYQFKPYIEYLLRLAGEKKTAGAIKSISANADEYSILVNDIKVAIESFLLEQEQKIDEDIKKTSAYIKEQYKTLSKEEFTKKYGEKKYKRGLNGIVGDEYYSLSEFMTSRLGILLNLSIERLPEFILKAQKSYRDKEYSKIDKLVYKLKQAYSSLNSFKLYNFNKGIDGIEFMVDANNIDGNVLIYTKTIYAGGYNIQRLHLRWLMQVSDSQGKKVKIEQG